MSEHKSSVTPQQKKVYLYIIILFTAAFLLILWSFFATHRSNQQVLDELRGNQDAMQSAIAENIALGDENEQLEDEVQQLRDDLTAAIAREDLLKGELNETTAELEALKAQLAELLTEAPVEAGN